MHTIVGEGSRVLVKDSKLLVQIDPEQMKEIQRTNLLLANIRAIGYGLFALVTIIASVFVALLAEFFIE